MRRLVLCATVGTILLAAVAVWSLLDVYRPHPEHILTGDWITVREHSEAVLPDGVTLVVGHFDNGYPDLRSQVRDVDGNLHLMKKIQDFQVHLAPLTSAELALAYSDCLRRLHLRNGDVRGRTSWSVGEWTRSREFYEQAQAMGVDGHTRVVQEHETGWVLFRPTLHYIDSKLCLVRLVERIGRDGQYRFKIEETLAPDASGLLYRREDY